MGQLSHGIFLFSLIFISVIEDTMAFHGFKTPCTDKSARCLKDFLQSVTPEFINGIPELGISSLDPFIVDKVNLLLPGGLKIEFLQGQSRGLKKCIIDSASISGDNFDLQVHCNFAIKGKYRSHGKFMMFTIDGDGDSTILCKNIKFDITFKLGVVNGPDGRKHLDITNFKSKHSYNGQVHYNITNLFRGNPEVSKAVVDFMNSNWQMVAEEFGDPIVDYGVTSILKNVKKLFQLVPLEDLITV